MFTEDAMTFDIETVKNDVADSFMPEFEADSRLTDPVKMNQSIINKQEAWRKKCALDPVTGSIVCIGYIKSGDPMVEAVNDGLLPADDRIVPMADETLLLQSFWKKYHGGISEYMVGWNIHEFDMWFIYQRCKILKVKTGINPLDRNWNMTIDLMEVWNRFNRRKMSALDEVAKALGVGNKLEGGEISKRFGFFWQNNRKLAIENVVNDIVVTEKVMECLLD